MNGKAVVIGNAAVDETLAVDALPRPGESVVGRFVMRDPGGKGMNVATVLARAGIATSLVAVIGRDERGDFLRDRLAAERAAGAALDACLVAVPGVPSDLSLVYALPDGDNAIVTLVAAAQAMLPAHAAAALDTTAAGDLVVLQGNLSQRTTLALLEQARSRSLVVALNPSPLAPWLHEAIARVQIVFVNEDEAEALTGVQAEAAAQALLAVGPDRVVITQGAAGALLGTRVGDAKAQVSSVPAVPARVVDTTGAGDTFMAVALSSAIRRGTVLDSQALRHAARAAALTVSRQGAASALPSGHELARLLG